MDQPDLEERLEKLEKDVSSMWALFEPVLEELKQLRKEVRK